MKNNYIFNFFFLFLLFFSKNMFAQQELMLHQMPNIWHKNSLNPAWFPDDKHIAIGLPSLTLDQFHSGKISLNDFIRKENGNTFYDLTNVIPKLDAVNNFNINERIETVSFGIKLAGWGLSVGHAIRFSGDVIYPKSMAELLWEGNGKFIGKTAEIGPKVNFWGCNELSLGISKKILNVRVGARVKYLSGIGALRTDDAHQKASVYTDADIYQLSLTTDYAFQSAVVVSAFDTSGLGYDIKTNKLKTGQLFSKNNGIAFDLGATFKLTDRIQVQANLLDLAGTIKWKDNANYFKSQGTYQYSGIKIPGADIINASDSLSIEGQLDSLNDIFQFQKSATSFNTKLPVRMYVGATVQLTKKLGVGASFYRLQSKEKTATAIGLNAQFTPLKLLSFGLMYSINDKTKANLGLNLIVKPGPVQIYFASDNILNGVSGNASPSVNFRVGAGLVF
jgi:hypothetical protein